MYRCIGKVLFVWQTRVLFTAECPTTVCDRCATFQQLMRDVTLVCSDDMTSWFARKIEMLQKQKGLYCIKLATLVTLFVIFFVWVLFCVYYLTIDNHD